MAHLQLSAVAGGRPAAAGGRGDEMEDVALLDSYDVEMGVPPPGGAEEEAAAEAHVRVTGMTCSACTSAVEAAVSARRGVRRVAVSLLQNRAHVVFDPALAKVTMLLCSLPFLPPRWCGVAWRGDAILARARAPAAPGAVGSSRTVAGW
jgi:Cu+-exporting ATPase